ncbi:MAG TPA: carbohydrate-binding domain-containing protein [Pirellulales bacterium]|nr:carbohydrate-binding domain-containing protein [Pirellulales bacterium]
MKSIPFWSVLISISLFSVVALTLAADQDKSDVIKIQLKDFKFKPPATVANPDDVFVYNEDDEKLCFYTNGSAEAKFKLPSEGDWDVIVSASGDTATGVPTHSTSGPKVENIPPKFQLGFDGKSFGKEVPLTSDDTKDYQVVVPLTAGDHVISVAFTNDTYDPDGKYDSNLYINGVKLRPHKSDEPVKNAAK